MKSNTVWLLTLSLTAIILGINACAPTSNLISSTDSAGKPINAAAIPDAIPKVEARSKYGNPKSYVVFGKRYYVMNSSQGYVEQGTASWYGTKFHGRRTSSGVPFNMYEITAAHKSLPLPTYVEVTNLATGKKIIAKVNDRGPFHGDRIIDLSYAAAAKLGIFSKGTGKVEVRALSPAVSKKITKNRPKNKPLEEQVFIQLGAFKEKENAVSMQQKAQSIGIQKTAIYTSRIQTGGVLHRVRIGPIANPSQALKMIYRLKAAGIHQTRTVTESKPLIS